MSTMQKDPVIMIGTEGGADYAIIAVKEAVSIGLKALAEIQGYDQESGTVIVSMGYRVRGACHSVEAGGIKPCEIAPAHMGNAAMKAFPLLPFQKCDEKRASFYKSITGTVSIEDLKTKLLLPETHAPSVKTMLENLYVKMEDVQWKEDQEVVIQWVSARFAKQFQAYLDSMKLQYNITDVKDKILETDGNVTKVQFGKKPPELPSAE